MPIYRLLATLFALAVLLRAALRGDLAGAKARLGLAPGPQTGGPHLWLHAASNGELASARPVIDALLADDPARRLLVTCNSDTGLELVRGWQIPQIEARPAPLDLAWAARRMMARWQVGALILMEAELWPHRVLACPGPVILLGARMSAGTARTWARFPALARRVLGHVRYASAQDAASRERLVTLGLEAGRFGPDLNLKALYRPQDLQDPAVERVFDRAATWLAASTHEGEEEIVAEAHLLARQRRPGLRLILAPRHPSRADEIVRRLSARGLSVARRSAGQPPEGADIYLADTLGEMDLWYRLAGTVFVGGSLVARGGHTPYEPACFACTILHGPDIANFRPAYGALHAARAAIEVTSARTLAEAVAGHAGDGSLGLKARAALPADPAAQTVLTAVLDRI